MLDRVWFSMPEPSGIVARERYYSPFIRDDAKRRVGMPLGKLLEPELCDGTIGDGRIYLVQYEPARVDSYTRGTRMAYLGRTVVIAGKLSLAGQTQKFTQEVTYAISRARVFNRLIGPTDSLRAADARLSQPTTTRKRPGVLRGRDLGNNSGRPNRNHFTED